MVDSSVVKCGVCCTAIGFIVGIFLTGFSFDYLDPLEAGIQYNTASVSIREDRIYTQGRYYLGLGQSFLRFPLTQQFIEFSNDRGADGPPVRGSTSSAEIIIDVSLQYKLRQVDLISLYRRYRQQYHSRLVSIALSALQEGITTRQVQDFYNARQAVALALRTTVTTQLNEHFVDVVGFQLRRVELPAATNGEIVNTAVQAERSRTQTNAQARSNELAKISVIQGQADADVTVLRAAQIADAQLIRQSSRANATSIRLRAEEKAFEGAKVGLSLANSELLRYIYLQSLAAPTAASRLLVGFDKPILSIA